MRNLQEQVKKAFCDQKLFWTFTVWINCSCDLKNFANSRPSASNFKKNSESLEFLFFFNFHLNCSNSSSLRNLQEQVKKAFCYQKLFWTFTVWIHCSSDLKHFAIYRPSALNFKSCSQSLEQFFLTVGQTNFGNKIPLPSLLF